MPNAARSPHLQGHRIQLRNVSNHNPPCAACVVGFLSPAQRNPPATWCAASRCHDTSHDSPWSVQSGLVAQPKLMDWKLQKCQYLKIHLIFKHLTISSVPTKTGNSYLVSKNWISKLLLTPTKTSGTLFFGAFVGPGALLRATAGIFKASFHCGADDLGGAPRTGEV